MFKYAKKNSIPYLQSEIFTRCDFLDHAFCTRHGGASREDYKSLNVSYREGDDVFRVRQNWSTLARSFAIPLDRFLVLNQVHGDEILVVETGDAHLSSPSELSYDAVVTNRRGLAVCIKTADCVPVFIVDRAKKVIAAVHAGWRGTALAVSAKVLRLMYERYGSRPRDILAAIGPSIGLCCYEVDDVTAEAFSTQRHKEYFLFPNTAKSNKWMVDLPEANRRQILDCGIPEAHIESSGYCTMCNSDLFFSHRGSGGITGRQISFMIIR